MRKRLKISLLCLLSVIALAAVVELPGKAGWRALLAWDHDAPEEIASYRLVLWQDGVAQAEFLVDGAMKVGLTNLMGTLPNGIYQVTASAVNHGGRESLPSEELHLFWYGWPSAPSRPRIEVP